jgi:hypothetical protein
MISLKQQLMISLKQQLKSISHALAGHVRGPLPPRYHEDTSDWRRHIRLRVMLLISHQAAALDVAGRVYCWHCVAGEHNATASWVSHASEVWTAVCVNSYRVFVCCSRAIVHGARATFSAALPLFRPFRSAR